MNQTKLNRIEPVTNTQIIILIFGIKHFSPTLYYITVFSIFILSQDNFNLSSRWIEAMNLSSIPLIIGQLFFAIRFDVNVHRAVDV